MNDFNAGDRVKYTGNISSKMAGTVGVVVKSPFANTGLVYFEHGGEGPYGAYPQSLTKLPAPDIITIDRADLPEVVEGGDGMLIVNGKPYPDYVSPESRRAVAREYIAVAEFLDAREKAAADIAAKRTKRRDELADELAPRAYDYLGANWYGNVGEPLRKAIDRIIDLEDAQ